MPPTDDVKYWEKRAEETRAVADRMKDEKSKAMMLRVAEDYDNLARLAAELVQRLASPPEIGLRQRSLCTRPMHKRLNMASTPVPKLIPRAKRQSNPSRA
jgi:hypothetical protein